MKRERLLDRLAHRTRLRHGARTVLGLVVPALLLHPAADVRARELAGGRAVRWTHSPNYARSTDSGDSLQLTDGQYATGAWIWLDPRSVGWERQPGDVVGLVLDLGSSCRVDSIVVHTAWFSRSGVLPPSIVGAVGVDDSHLAWAGAFDAGTLAITDSTQAQRVRVAVPFAGAGGRTVVVAALLRGAFLFIDEVEVWGEQESPRVDPSAPRGEGGAPADARGAAPIGRAFAIADLDAVCAKQRRAWSVRAALPQPASFARATLSEEEATRFAARAARWRESSPQRLQVRRVDPWAPITPWSGPRAELRDTLHLWPGAWGAAAVEVASSDSLERHLELRVEPAPVGAPRATLRQVVAVESRPGSWIGDALPLAGESLAVRAGEVRQVWVDVETAGSAPGRYDIVVHVASGRAVIPVRVHAIRPGGSPLAAFDWTYPEKFGLTRRAPAAAVRDNRAHGIDAWCLPMESVPWPDPAAIDVSGHVRRFPSFEAADRQVALHGGTQARWLGWYLHLEAAPEDPSRGRFRHPYLSRAWKRAFLEWLDAWLEHLEARGLDRRRLFLQAYDETTAQRAEDFYAFLHAARPDLRLALTVTRNASRAELQRFGRHLGIVILEREALARHAAWVGEARSHGTEVWVYDVPEPSKLADPTREYRALAWEAWARGLSGCGFWSYGDTGDRSADAWDDFDGGRSDYGVVYGPQGAPVLLGDEPFAPSKRWQAFRIGIQEAALLEAAVDRRPHLRDEVLAALRDPQFDPEAWRAACITALEGAR